jgi:hypothetical protein
MLITREVTGATQLDHFVKSLEAEENDASLKEDIYRQIIHSIATNLRKIHDQHFYHDDMKWRNVLVRRVGDHGERVEVFWIDCPNGYIDKTKGLRKNHGRIKDLATMDYDARQWVGKEERLYFLHVYSGLEVGSPEFNELASQVVEYRKMKIDDDRPRKKKKKRG